MASNLESSPGDIAGAIGTDVFPNDHEADILKLDNGAEVPEAEVIVEVQKETNDEPEEHEEIELSPEGILDEETIARGLSNIGSSANGIHQVYLNVSIPGFSLINIDALSGYRHLQKVEIPHNNITDLSALGKLKHLLILNASHNKIEKLLDFEPPANLQEVDLAWNNITEMSDLSAHHCLQKLILDNNSIITISGLQNCKRLKHLSLVHNKIAMIQGLDNLPIQYLNLSHNKLKTLDNLETLSCLWELKLMGNCIRSLSGLNNNKMLESLDLEANEVIDLLEMNHIKHIKNLRSLNLLRNPIQELPDYRLYILFKLSKLVVLDRHMMAEEEKVAAINMFQPPDEAIAFQDHMTNVVYAFLQPMKVWNSTLPSIETSYPMLVLVGPQGSGKKNLARKLVDEFGDYFGYGISHTTKNPRLDEVAERDYHFVSLEQFIMDAKNGKFIQSCQFKDEWFGLQMETIEDVAKEGLACVVHMELEGVLTLKKTHFEPRYILILPLDHEAHELRLRERHIYAEADIRQIQRRTEVYIQHNQEHPGFFDMMICSDNITEAYIQLRKLVMDYLGISSITSASTADPTAVSETHAVEKVQPTTGRVPSNVMRAQSWSKPSISESFSQGSGTPGRGFVEEESIKRRYSAAKDIVTGYVPPLTERLQMKYPDSASRLSERKSDSKERSAQNADSTASSHYGYDAKREVSELPDSPDSSDRTSCFSSVSDPFSATELSRVTRVKFNRNMNFQDTLPTEKVDPLLLIDEPSYHAASGAHISNTPITLPDSTNALSRPGSNRHAVLPPIQSSVA